MRTWSRCGGREIPFFLRALLLDGKTVCGACKRAVTLLFKSFVAGWKTVCGACKQAVYLCFLGCAEMRRPLLTGLSAAGLLGVAVDKVTRCVAIPALLAVWEWRRQAGVSCAAKSSVSSLLCKKKDCSTWVLPSIAVLFVYSTLSVIAALCRFPQRKTLTL